MYDDVQAISHHCIYNADYFCAFSRVLKKFKMIYSICFVLTKQFQKIFTTSLWSLSMITIFLAFYSWISNNKLFDCEGNLIKYEISLDVRSTICQMIWCNKDRLYFQMISLIVTSYSTLFMKFNPFFDGQLLLVKKEIYFGTLVLQ